MYTIYSLNKLDVMSRCATVTFLFYWNIFRNSLRLICWDNYKLQYFRRSQHKTGGHYRPPTRLRVLSSHSALRRRCSDAQYYYIITKLFVFSSYCRSVLCVCCLCHVRTHEQYMRFYIIIIIIMWPFDSSSAET